MSPNSEALSNIKHLLGFPSGSNGKESAGSVGDLVWIPDWGGSPCQANGYPLQYSCLENPMDRGACQATVHGVTKELDMTEQLTLSCKHLLSHMVSMDQNSGPAKPVVLVQSCSRDWHQVLAGTAVIRRPHPGRWLMWRASWSFLAGGLHRVLHPCTRLTPPSRMSDQRGEGRSHSVFRYTWDISQRSVCIVLLVSQWGRITEGVEA